MAFMFAVMMNLEYCGENICSSVCDVAVTKISVSLLESDNASVLLTSLTFVPDWFW